MNSNLVEMIPPLNLSTNGEDQDVDILGHALTDVAEGRVADNVLEGFEGWYKVFIF